MEATLVTTNRLPGGEVACADVGNARLVTGGGDRTLRVWIWQAGEGWTQAGERSRAHRFGITGVRWGPAGQVLASAGIDGAVRLWSTELVALKELAAPGATAVRSLCWASAGVLVSGHDDGSVLVWLARRASLLARLAVHEGALHAVCVPAGGALLLTACTHAVLKVFRMKDVISHGVGESETNVSALTPLLWVDGVHDMGALSADCSPDGRLAATGGHDAKIRIWICKKDKDERRDIEAGQVLEGHSAGVTSLRWSDGVSVRGSTLASASLDRTARLWSSSGACMCVIHAHTRYLTSIYLAPDLRYLITGSNDKTVRTWSLSSFSIDDDIEYPCTALSHFAMNDFESIGYNNDAVLVNDVAATRGVERVWSSTVAPGTAINFISTHGDLLATASSDGAVRIYRCTEMSLDELHCIQGHEYPCLCVTWGWGGDALGSAGSDGRACIWDSASGVSLRTFISTIVSESSGGGARALALSAGRPPLLLLASDAGIATLWDLRDNDHEPAHVYDCSCEALTCAAWSRVRVADTVLDVAAVGDAGGALRILSTPPNPKVLFLDTNAHDMGVQSCDFADPSPFSTNEDAPLLLATAGADERIKLWIMKLFYDEDGELKCTMSLSLNVAAHGGGASCVNWKKENDITSSQDNIRSAWLASSGMDRWARVWKCEIMEKNITLTPVIGVPVVAAGGAPAAAIVSFGLLAVGDLAGELSLWRVPLTENEKGEDDADLDLAPRFWSQAGVARWIRDYITRVPGSSVSSETEAELIQASNSVSGSILLDGTLDDALTAMGQDCFKDEIETEQLVEVKDSGAVIKARLEKEILWLRRDPPTYEDSACALHSLLCPLTHRLMSDPVRAADGKAYERTALREADGGMRSRPDYAMRRAVQEYRQLRDSMAEKDGE